MGILPTKPSSIETKITMAPRQAPRAPPAKRRKTTTQVDELKFDPEARNEWLTGFRKRKQQRIKHAQEQSAKIEKEEKVRARKEMRDQRKVDLERHVAEVNDLLRKANKDSDDEDSAAEDDEEWDGIASPPRPSIDGVDEYVDEDKYTTVTIEAMEDAKAFTKDSDDEAETAVVKEDADAKDEAVVKKKTMWSKGKKVDFKDKPKKKKFRYESKGERKETRNKQRSKNAAAKKARTEK
ncbi:hypothetical protein D6D10_03533 [Aureobasidium pullulans]|uniref:Nucleolar protein 12 n=1 Tax=Aureobasidium pullulans TaxID=5580 RepID=A0A4S9EZF9_AURPU|nr:hypothetical protein D6D10_03533 [Aureobasidium pullulans]